jgi:hypothetical protein
VKQHLGFRKGSATAGFAQVGVLCVQRAPGSGWRAAHQATRIHSQRRIRLDANTFLCWRRDAVVLNAGLLGTWEAFCGTGLGSASASFGLACLEP